MNGEFEKNLRILELDIKADMDEIKSAYRKLVKIHHPDLYKNPENIEKASKNFKIITNAYEYLRENYIPPENRNFSYSTSDNTKKKTTYDKGNFTKYSEDSNDSLIKLLKQCINNKIRVKITYRTSNYYHRSVTQRIILPLELYLGSELKKNNHRQKYNYGNNKMYLIAYCELRKSKRTFRLDRIIDIKIYNEASNGQNFNEQNEKETNNLNNSQDKSNDANFEIQDEKNSNLGCIIFIVIIVIVIILGNMQ